MDSSEKRNSPVLTSPAANPPAKSAKNTQAGGGVIHRVMHNPLADFMHPPLVGRPARDTVRGSMSDQPPPPSASGRLSGEKEGRARLQGPGKKKPSDASALYDPARALPSAVDMERCVISCLMQAPDFAVGVAMERLTPEHFSIEAHSLLYDTVVRQFDAGKPVDPVSLTQVLHDRDLIGQIGGPAVIAEVYTASPNPAHVAHYAEQVQQKAILRNIIKACSDCIGRAFDDQENVGPLLDEVESRILGIREAEEAKRGTLTMKERVFKAIDDLEKLAANPNAINGLPTGLQKLDEMTGACTAGK